MIDETSGSSNPSLSGSDSFHLVLRVLSGDATTDPAPAPEGLFVSQDGRTIALGRITARAGESP